jgi:membrane protease YdiL (CAAX protease family)
VSRPFASEVSILNPIALMLLSALALAAAAGLAVAALARAGAARDGRRLPPSRRPAAPWSGVEVFLALIAFVIGPVVAELILNRCGFFTLLYGPGFPLTVMRPDDDPSTRAAAVARAAWSMLIATPFVAAVIFGLLHGSSGARPYQLGLTAYRWRSSVTAGYLTWLAVTPAVFGIHILVNAVYAEVNGVPPEQHPLGQAVQWVSWAVLGFQVVLAGPFLEEFFFRGTLQPWLAKSRANADIGMAAALAVAVMSRLNAGGPWWDRFAPALFVLALLPAYALVAPRRPAAGVFASAAVFAVFHASVWPTPVPLFVLGLALGWLAYRTRSLVAPVVLHALFNAVSFVWMCYGLNE